MRRGRNQSAVIIISTFPNKESIIQNVNDLIIEKKLCACISLVPIRSFYSWSNKLEDHEEIMVLLKTTKSLATKLKLEVARIHPYDVPEIIEVKMNDVSKSYLKWMIDSIKN